MIGIIAPSIRHSMICSKRQQQEATQKQYAFLVVAIDKPTNCPLDRHAFSAAMTLFFICLMSHCQSVCRLAFRHCAAGGGS